MHEVGLDGLATGEREVLLRGVLGLEGGVPGGCEEQGVLHHQAGVLGDGDAAVRDEAGRVARGPGIEVVLHRVHLDLLDLGGEPAQHCVEVGLLDLDVLLIGDENMVGQVGERLVRDLVRVESLELAVVAVQGALDGRPGAVAVLPREPQECVIALSSGIRGAVGQDRQDKGEAEWGGHRRRR